MGLAILQSVDRLGTKMCKVFQDRLEIVCLTKIWKDLYKSKYMFNGLALGQTSARSNRGLVNSYRWPDCKEAKALTVSTVTK